MKKSVKISFLVFLAIAVLTAGIYFYKKFKTAPSSSVPQETKTAREILKEKMSAPSPLPSQEADLNSLPIAPSTDQPLNSNSPKINKIIDSSTAKTDAPSLSENKKNSIINSMTAK